MVNAKELVKTYGKKNRILAVDKASFSVNKGEIFGLIGPDGAGKTSIFRMLTTLLLPDGGSASVNGFDVVDGYLQIRSSVGYMPGRFSLYQDLSVEENLDFYATLFGTTVKENYYLIKDIYVQLEPFKKRRAGKLSGGMKQKLALCCALIHKPEVLFLDEPTTGVDAVSRREFWEMLRRLHAQGITILVSTPYMDEAALCDRIALIQKGKLLSIETPEKIIDAYPHTLYSIKAIKIPPLLKAMSSYEDILSNYAFGDSIHVTFRNNGFDEDKVKNYLQGKGLENIEIKEIRATIEDCFINLLT